MRVLDAVVMLLVAVEMSSQTPGSQPAMIGVTASGAPKCLLSVDAGRSDQLVIHVVAPQPGADMLASLPAALQNVEEWPAVVVLLDENRASGAVQRLPLSLATGSERPTVNGVPTAESYFRAVFPKQWLVAGTTILGERRAKSPSGGNISTQTRCQITAVDAAKWQ
jgi:hypothetical protein